MAVPVEGRRTVIPPVFEPSASPKNELAAQTVVTIHSSGHQDLSFHVATSLHDGAAFLLTPTDGVSSKPIILKPLPSTPNSKDEQASFQSFVEHQTMLNEAQAAGITRVPRALGFLHIDEGENAGWYTMEEYREGVSLNDYLEQHDLSVKQKLQLFEQLVETVAALHKIGIIHRDINPGNVLIAADGSLTLIDFGVSGKTGEPLGYIRSAFGTDGYRPIEQMGIGQRSQPSNDTYALGMFLFSMFGGEPSDIHTADAALAQMQSPVLNTEAYASLYTSANATERYIAAIIFFATQFNITQRNTTSSSDQMLIAVRQAIAAR